MLMFRQRNLPFSRMQSYFIFSENGNIRPSNAHRQSWGWQYRHHEYRRRLKERGVVQSMSRKGNCLDNALAESFFGTMKSELLYARKFESPDEFVKALDKYIDYYNNKRIKSRLNGKSPVQFRVMFEQD